MERKRNVNRRDFIRLSATVGASAFVLPGGATSAVSAISGVEENKIPIRALGKTGIMLPILSMGVMRADIPGLLKASYNSGIIHFDTAHGYQNGKNEEMVGTFFDGKPRDTYCIATKVKFNYPLSDNFEEDLNEKLELSLKRLKMDYVDIFYAHAYDTIDPIRDPRVIAALKKIKSEGKARHIGFSTHAHGRPEQLDAAIEAGIYEVILTSYNFKLDNLKETDEAIERAAKAGIGIIAMKTMTGGTEDANGKKKIDAKACLKWAWQNKHITTAIPGYVNYDELDECLSAAGNTVLTQDEEKYLAELTDAEMLYCQRCEACKSQCVNNLPIPDIMRAYMYAYGYKQANLSKDVLMDLTVADNACSGCGTCKVVCPSGFNIPQKIAAILPVINTPSEFLS